MNAQCPTCKVEILSTKGVIDEESKPSPGDLSICYECGELLQFKDDMTLEVAPEESFPTLPTRMQILIVSVRRWIREFKATKQ